ncbi:ataxin-7-like protein 1 isoform X3 [Branchiostoma lanceolatum]|uniref:ataxin-7-like protein 1 isoform X3 n=1 Tax=Branchiostoma lanceolatum TaxID=7740 RepID=UPI00345377C4
MTSRAWKTGNGRGAETVMATLNSSIERCRGQPWAVWADTAPNNDGEGSDLEENSVPGREVVRFKKEDMRFYGVRPMEDEVLLVVCERCGQVVKPQALQYHIEHRHGGKDSDTSSMRSATMIPTGRPPGLTSPHHGNPRPSVPAGRNAKSGGMKLNHLVPVVALDRSADLTALKKSAAAAKKSSNSKKSTSSSSSSKSSFDKERKIPLKDREYDPNKHCGVWLPDMKKPCTRSLTCKTHALSLRRAVPQRRKPFDELLAEHKARAREREREKEMENKLKEQQRLASLSAHSAAFAPEIVPQKITSPTKPAPRNSPGVNSVFQRPSFQPSGQPADTRHVSPEPKARPGSDGEGEEEADSNENLDCPHILNHPRPATMCAFGARRFGTGCYMFSRRTDLLRSAFTALLERQLHSPPLKRPASEPVESLHQATTDHQEPTFDPYDPSRIGPTLDLGYKPPLLAQTWDLPLSKPVAPAANKPSKSRKTKDSTSSRSKKKKSSSGGGSSVQPPDVSLSMNNSGVYLTSANGAVSLSTPTGYTITSNIPHISTQPATKEHLARLGMAKGTPAISTTLGDSIKGLSIVVTNIDPLVNGQVINVGSGVVQRTPSRESASGNAAGAICSTGSSSSSSHAASSSAKSRKRSSSSSSSAKSKGGSKPSNGTHSHKSAKSSGQSQGGAGSASGVRDAGGGVGSNSFSPLQRSPSTTPSPLFRPGSISPQIADSSPLPNGIGPSPPGVGMKGFPPTINHYQNVNVISPGQHSSSPSPGSTDVSPSNSGHMANIAKFSQSQSGTSSSSMRANAQFQKHIANAAHKQHIDQHRRSPSLASKSSHSNQHAIYNHQVYSGGQQRPGGGAKQPPPPFPLQQVRDF